MYVFVAGCIGVCESLSAGLERGMGLTTVPGPRPWLQEVAGASREGGSQGIMG